VFVGSDDGVTGNEVGGESVPCHTAGIIGLNVWLIQEFISVRPDVIR
jgi:hypothetical protein